MRIVRLFPFACAALMMSACASENDDKGGDIIAEGKAQYMAVNIVSVGTNGSRAAEYDHGLEKESTVDNVRFYFFNSDGSPYILKNNADRNWVVPTQTIEDEKDKPNENVTKITKSNIVFQPENGNSAPYSVVAVVNAKSLETGATNTLGNDKKSLSDLLSSVQAKQFYDLNGSTATTNYGKANDSKNFVMTNSVYLKDDAQQCQTFVSGNVYKTADEAKQKPVDIYVERVVAKVTADVDKTNKNWRLGNGTDWDNTKYGKVVGKTTNGTEVFAVIEGWNVADENATAMLEKQIDKTWTTDGLGFATDNPWNTNDYHRCFWEQSTEAGATGNDLINYSYTTIAGNKLKNVVYTLPNTLQTATTEKYNNKLTKFIVAATLRYQNPTTNTWEKVEICRYKGIEYIGQNAVLDVIGSESGIYVKKAGSSTYTSLGHDQLKFTKDKTSGAKDYKAIAAVDGDKVNVSELYTKDNTTGNYTNVASLDFVNKAIQKENADVRASGKTYYYIPIRHLGTDDTKQAYYGVVRNHFYQITISDMQGFGTPVVKEDETIIPTKPEYDDTYLAAKINVLSWRVVKQDADLDYNK